MSLEYSSSDRARAGKERFLLAEDLPLAMRTPVEVRIGVAVLFFSGILYNILFRAYSLKSSASPGKITRHLLDA